MEEVRREEMKAKEEKEELVVTDTRLTRFIGRMDEDMNKLLVVSGLMLVLELVFFGFLAGIEEVLGYLS